MSVQPVSHFTWQVLRTARRSKTPLTGKQLRLAPTRRTKDGTFLDDLVTEGLLEVVGQDEPTGQTKGWPEQFRRRYRLTRLGEHAAEYGEYQSDPARRPASPEPDVPAKSSAGRRSRKPSR